MSFWTARVKQPHQHDVAALPVSGRDGAAVVAHGCGDAVVSEAVSEVLRRGEGRLCCQGDKPRANETHQL